MRLDQFVAKRALLGRKRARVAIDTGLIKVDGVIVKDQALEVDRFMQIDYLDDCLQSKVSAYYLMMHKPAGILSATVDAEHLTVIDLVDLPNKESLHLAGRLDRASTGLILLTNDGRWSKRLMAPELKVEKRYLVETLHDISPEAVQAFHDGFYFHTEDRYTLPARLEVLAPRQARVIIQEGLYHQIKRMFHRVENRVVNLHREAIGRLNLDTQLQVGEYRQLSVEECEMACQSVG